MIHRNARLTPTGREILVERVLAGRPIAHVAKEMGISRTCAHRWIGRYRAHGWAGLQDPSSRPKSCPHATPATVVADVLTQRVEHREGPMSLALRCGISARTVSRILARAGMPRLWDLDPMTGAWIRASRATDRRYERDAPGEMIHVDVKKLGRIPDGGGWRADPSQSPANHRASGQRMGFDYVHVAVDDYTRFAYAEVLPDEKGPTCAGFLTRAAAVMAAHGAPVKRGMTDNAFAYRLSRDFQEALAALDTKHLLIKPRHPFASNQARTQALQPWLDFYNHHRPHGSLGGKPPISRCNQPTD